MTGQKWDPETYARNAGFVSKLGEPLLDLLRVVPGEKILDLGCGDGALTEKLIAAGAQVIGVDASAEQVQAAQRRGIDARVCQVEDLPFIEEFDAVFSNAVLHWVKDQPAALRRIYQSLKPGGRLVAELGGSGCVNNIREAIHNALRSREIDPWLYDPWFFPTVEEYTNLLNNHGFEIGMITLFPRPTPLPGDISGWLETFAIPFQLAIAPDDRTSFIQEVRERLMPVLFNDDDGWVADYVRLRLRAVRSVAG